jgi:two-component system, OmpR family, copper resistance phosphate regulon response regulator CusR
MRVLVVEDDHKIAHSIKKGLELELMTIDLAYDGDKGYDLASTEGYDVIVLDLMLPKLSGLEICKKLRSDGVHTPVLILTAKGSVEDKVEGLNSGAGVFVNIYNIMKDTKNFCCLGGRQRVAVQP